MTIIHFNLRGIGLGLGEGVGSVLVLVVCLCSEGYSENDGHQAGERITFLLMMN